MKPPEGMTLTAVERTHECPPHGSNLMPCCGKTPSEVSRYHRITTDDRMVTCNRPFVRYMVGLDRTA